MKHLSLILLTLLGVLAMRADFDADARERKSDWYFMEALRQHALGHDVMYYSMMGRAADLSPDPADRSVFERSIQDLFLSQSIADSLGVVQALKRAETYFNANPSDTYAGSYLARVNAELGNATRTLEIYDLLEREKPNDIGIVANHAEYLMRIDRLDDAVNLYRKLEKTMGRNPQLTQRIANIRAWQGDSIGALAEVDSLIAAYPRSVDALHLGAIAAGALGMPEQVIAYTDRALEIDPTDGPSYYYAANAYKELGRKEEYERAVHGALFGDDLDVDDKIELLQYYMSAIDEDQQLADLDKVFQSLVSQYPQQYSVRKFYFAYLASYRKYDEAAEQLQHAINISASNPDDFNVLARVYATAGQYAQAIKVAEEGMARFPGELEFYTIKSGCQLAQDDYAAAAATIRAALALPDLSDSEQAEFYSTLGDLAQRDPALGTPKEYYDKALELDRTNHLAMNNYAYWLSTSGGDLIKAKELISKAMLYMPDQSTYLDTMAWVCYKLGQIEEAQRYIDKALSTDGNDPDMADDPQMAELLQHAGDIYDRLGQRERAKEYWKRAKAIDADIKSE